MASREGFLRPASCSGRDAAARHRGLQSGVSLTRRPGDAYFRNDPQKYNHNCQYQQQEAKYSYIFVASNKTVTAPSNIFFT